MAVHQREICCKETYTRNITIYLKKYIDFTIESHEIQSDIIVFSATIRNKLLITYNILLTSPYGFTDQQLNTTFWSQHIPFIFKLPIDYLKLNISSTII